MARPRKDEGRKIFFFVIPPPVAPSPSSAPHPERESGRIVEDRRRERSQGPRGGRAEVAAEGQCSEAIYILVQWREAEDEDQRRSPSTTSPESSSLSTTTVVGAREEGKFSLVLLFCRLFHRLFGQFAANLARKRAPSRRPKCLLEV